MNIDKQLEHLMAANIPALLVGPPGVGKTARIEQLAKRKNYDFMTLYAWQLDPVDIAGLPIPDAGHTRIHRLLDEMIGELFQTAMPTILLIDELGQASPAQQAALTPLLMARKINNHVLPDHVYVAAATNRRTDRAGAGHILSHLISRTGMIEVKVNYDDFIQWALKNNIHPEVIALLRFRPSLLHNFDATIGEMVPYACPRSWAYMSKLLGNIALQDVYEMGLTVVGQAAAMELSAFCASSRALPNLDELLEKPHKIKLPKEPSARYALAAGLAYRINEKTAEPICTAAERLYSLNNGAEYAILLLRDAMQRFGDMIATSSWKRLCNSPLGSAINDL